MSYGEQVAWAMRVLEKPDAAREALKSVNYFAEDFAELYAEHEPKEAAAKQFYADMVANQLIEFALETRRD